MTASAPRTNPVSRLNGPARTYRSQRFANALTDAHAQLTAVADRYSFNVGLSHPLLYDGLSRRTTAQGRQSDRYSIVVEHSQLLLHAGCPALSVILTLPGLWETERIAVQITPEWADANWSLMQDWTLHERSWSSCRTASPMDLPRRLSAELQPVTRLGSSPCPGEQLAECVGQAILGAPGAARPAEPRGQGWRAL